jgi:hypothetical protein
MTVTATFLHSRPQHQIASAIRNRLAGCRTAAPTLVGIDHGFSFPLRYFEAHGLLPDWPRFLDDFQQHWPTDADHTYVEFVRDGMHGNGAARMGNARWRRLTEERAGGAKSVFHFDVRGSVAKSTHAGIPWAALHPPATRRPREFLAVRRLGHSGRAFGDCRGLSGALVARLCQRGPHRRPARRLQHRRLAFQRRSRWQPYGVPQAQSFAARTNFIRIEGAEGKLEVPGSRQGLRSIADGCNGHACLMPMRRGTESWIPAALGWGLLDLETGKAIDPVALVGDERIEMTDWELQDFAVQIVRDHLDKQGRKLMSCQGNPSVDPSIWFVGDHGPEWVVVRAVRYPKKSAEPPANWRAVAERCSRLGKSGYFVSVSVSNADDAFDPTGAVPPMPLWRGHAMFVSFEGIVLGPS